MNLNTNTKFVSMYLRNYYCENGSFDGISKNPLYKSIKYYAKDGATAMQYCSIGYKCPKDFKRLDLIDEIATYLIKNNEDINSLKNNLKIKSIINELEKETGESISELLVNCGVFEMLEVCDNRNLNSKVYNSLIRMLKMTFLMNVKLNVFNEDFYDKLSFQNGQEGLDYIGNYFSKTGNFDLIPKNIYNFIMTFFPKIYANGQTNICLSSQECIKNKTLYSVIIPKEMKFSITENVIRDVLYQLVGVNSLGVLPVSIRYKLMSYFNSYNCSMGILLDEDLIMKLNVYAKLNNYETINEMLRDEGMPITVIKPKENTYVYTGNQMFIGLSFNTGDFFWIDENYFSYLDSKELIPSITCTNKSINIDINGVDLELARYLVAIQKNIPYEDCVVEYLSSKNYILPSYLK